MIHWFAQKVSPPQFNGIIWNCDKKIVSEVLWISNQGHQIISTTLKTQIVLTFKDSAITPNWNLVYPQCTCSFIYILFDGLFTFFTKPISNHKRFLFSIFWFMNNIFWISQCLMILLLNLSIHKDHFWYQQYWT